MSSVGSGVSSRPAREMSGLLRLGDVETRGRTDGIPTSTGDVRRTHLRRCSAELGWLAIGVEVGGQGPTRDTSAARRLKLGRRSETRRRGRQVEHSRRHQDVECPLVWGLSRSISKQSDYRAARPAAGAVRGIPADRGTALVVRLVASDTCQLQAIAYRGNAQLTTRALRTPCAGRDEPSLRVLVRPISDRVWSQ